MIQTTATLTHKETIGPAWQRLTLSAPELAAALTPGQFLLLRCGDLFTAYLPRLIFPAPAGDSLTLLLRPSPDPGLSWLLSRPVGHSLELVGPLGTGFTLPETARNLLLISDVQTLAPLLGQMSRAVAAGLSVTLALGASRAAALYPAPALPAAVEFRAATLDGSLGQRGPVTALLPELLPWADLVCAVGSPRLYQALRAQAEAIRFGAATGFTYGLLAEPVLGCGLGACLGCSLATQAGSRLICVDGPVFDLALLEAETLA